MKHVQFAASRRARSLLLLSAAALLPAFAAGALTPARADDASAGQVETVVVTAQKRAENVQSLKQNTKIK